MKTMTLLSTCFPGIWSRAKVGAQKILIVDKMSFPSLSLCFPFYEQN